MLNLRQLHLDRRTLLRGGAAALALPWLDAMQPALAPKPRPALRCLFVFAPNGVDRARFRPVGDGRAATFGPTLQPLEPFAARVTVFGGLAVDGARAHGDGNGDHARAAASFLTCSHPRKTGSADLWAGTSIDQHIAGVVGHATPFASLELGLERGVFLREFHHRREVAGRRLKLLVGLQQRVQHLQLVDDALGLLLVVPEVRFGLFVFEAGAHLEFAGDVKESPGAG